MAQYSLKKFDNFELEIQLVNYYEEWQKLTMRLMEAVNERLAAQSTTG